MRWWLAIALAGSACKGGEDPTDDGAVTSPSDTGSDLASAEQLCVDTINDYRATHRLRGYERAVDQEPCVDGQAKTDHEINRAHWSFGDCGESAQNECIRWPGPARDMITSCLAAMWAEGPGTFPEHGHYINMNSDQYTRVACGFHTAEDGSVSTTQDFYP